MMYIKINGCDFHKEVAALSLGNFKKEFKNSFCKGKTDEEIEVVYNQLKELIPDQKTDSDVNSSSTKEKTYGSKRKRAGICNTSAK